MHVEPQVIKAFEVRCGKKLIAIIASLEEASILNYRLFRQSIRLAIPSPKLTLRDRDTGARYYISQNGRVWRGGPRDWKPGDEPVCEAQYPYDPERSLAVRS